MGKTKTSKKGKYLSSPKKTPVLPVILGTLAVLAVLIFMAFLLLNPGTSQKNTPSGDNGTENAEQITPTGTQGIQEETESREETGAQEMTDPQAETDSQDETEPQTEPAVQNEDVVNAYINDELHLILVLKDGTEVDKGYVGDSAAQNKTYVVAFKDHDGTVLKTESVKSGGNATPPDDPTREGYTFVGWNGSYTNVSDNVTLVAQYRENEPVIETFTVTFVDAGGNVLKTQVVEKGTAAEAPEAPAREGYEFTGWDQTFDKVEADLTVTARYAPIPDTDPTLYVTGVSAAAGESVQVAVMVKNNPGIAGARIILTFDEKLQLTAAEPGEAFSVLDYTAPAALVSSCAFNWDSLDAESGVDGTVLLLTFTVPADAAAGDRFPIKVSYRDGDIYNVDLNIVTLAAEDGCITVE